MPAHRTTLAALASVTLLLGAATPALAASSASSASSESVSTSVGSISGSFEKSSESSTGGGKTAGDYRVLEVAEAPTRPGMVRMKLQALPGGAGGAAEGEFFLYLPQQAADNSRVAAGHIVTARERPYGMEFAKAETREAFFLLLDDASMRDMQTKVVTL